jgi:hypothetical protein
MNGKCFEIGTIQAFLDGETSPDISLRLTDHVAGCGACAQVMADAEEENSIVFSTLERELNTLVPTQRLWSRINETIEVEKGRASVWQKALAYVTVSLANPSFAAAAGILLVLGMFAVVITLRDNQVIQIADNPKVGEQTPAPNPTPVVSNEGVSVARTDSEPGIPAQSIPKSSVTFTNMKPGELNKLAASVKSNQRTITPQYAIDHSAAADTFSAGEEGYVKTIAELKQNVDLQKDTVLTPSTRVSYERDMAVVNDSIKRMREVVKKNPRNQAARQVLYSSYQDKIDLLNSVVQREELMASLR